MADITSGDHFSLADGCDGLSDQNSVHKNRIARREVAEGKLMLSRHVSEQDTSLAVEAHRMTLGQID